MDHPSSWAHLINGIVYLPIILFRVLIVLMLAKQVWAHFAISYYGSLEMSFAYQYLICLFKMAFVCLNLMFYWIFWQSIFLITSSFRIFYEASLSTSLVFSCSFMCVFDTSLIIIRRSLQQTLSFHLWSSNRVAYFTKRSFILSQAFPSRSYFKVSSTKDLSYGW